MRSAPVLSHTLGYKDSRESTCKRPLLARETMSSSKRSKQHYDRDDRSCSRNRRDRDSDYDHSSSRERKRRRYNDEDDGYSRHDNRQYERKSSSDKDDYNHGQHNDRYSYRNARRSSNRRNEDWHDDRRQPSRSNERGSNHSDDGTSSSFKDPVDIKLDDSDLEESCTYVCELPDDITKEALVRFVCKQYRKERNINPEIAACSIRDYKNDACVQFRDPYHARYAEEVLDNVKFQGFEVRVPRWESKYLSMFRIEAYTDATEEPKAEPEASVKEGNENVEPPKDATPSSIVGYFKEQQKAEKSIYVYNLPSKLKPGELKKFIIQQYLKTGESKPDFTALHLRSLKNDACVEFKTIGNCNVAIDLLDCRDIKSEQIRVASWIPKFSKDFSDYYQNKVDRKKQKRADMEKKSELLRLANEKLESEKTSESELLMEEIEKLKADNDRLRSNLSSMTRDHLKSKQDGALMLTENEELKKSLHAKDRERKLALDQLGAEAQSAIAKLQKELDEENEKSELQANEIVELKQEVHEIHKRLTMAQEQNAQDRESWQAQQKELFEKQQKVDDIKNELGAAHTKIAKEKKKKQALERGLNTKQMKLEDARRQLQENLTNNSAHRETVKTEGVNTEKHDIEI